MFPDPYERIVRLFDDGEFALAAEVARHFLDLSPEDGRLWQLFGTACCNLNDFAAGLDALETASSLTPLHPLAQLALATCYARLGKHELATMMFEHLGEATEEPKLLARVARCLGALGRDAAALAVCRKLTRIDPANHSAHFGLAFYLQRLGASPESLIAPLAMALDLAPEVAAYRINLAFAWAKLGRTRQAYELLMKVSLETVGCSCTLQRLRAIFDSIGDHARSLVCQVRLSCLRQ
jgi:Flp pilus assembly protein TadD